MVRVKFTNLSRGNPERVSWVWGDGTMSAVLDDIFKPVIHTYYNEGEPGYHHPWFPPPYTVTLYAWRGNIYSEKSLVVPIEF
jgi:hypothetical protein